MGLRNIAGKSTCLVYRSHQNVTGREHFEDKSSIALDGCLPVILMLYALSFCFVGTEGGTCPQMAWGNSLAGWLQMLWLVFTFTLCSLLHPCQYLPLTFSISFWQLSCKILHFFHQYMMACNYFWMLCEGIYLHTLIVVAVFTEEQHLRWYYLLGWGMYFPSWVLSHLHLCLHIYSLLLVLVSEND